MTCEELKALVGAYALGALDDDEVAAVEAHLRAPAHEGCQEALAQAVRAVDALPVALPAARPEAGTWAAIQREIGATAPASGARAAPAAAARRPAGRPRQVAARAIPWLLLAAAAVLLLWMRDRLGAERDARRQVVATASAIERDRDNIATTASAAIAARTRCEADLQDALEELALRDAAVAMLDHPATRVVGFDLKSQGSAAGATAIVNMDEKRAMVVARGMAAPAGKDYELWVIRGNEKIAAGILRGGGEGRLIAVVDPKLLALGADALAVTLESEGGGPAPHGELVLVATMPRS